MLRKASSSRSRAENSAPRSDLCRNFLDMARSGVRQGRFRPPGALGAARASLLPQVTACLREGGSLRHHNSTHGMAHLTSLVTTATSPHLLVVRSGWGSCEAPCVATCRPRAGLFLFLRFRGVPLRVASSLRRAARPVCLQCDCCMAVSPHEFYGRSLSFDRAPSQVASRGLARAARRRSSRCSRGPQNAAALRSRACLVVIYFSA